MEAVYDDVCPGCRRGTRETPPADRVCCGVCLSDHHRACWGFGPGCARCGVTETLADRQAQRDRARGRGRAALVLLTLALLVAVVVPFRPFGLLRLGFVEVDALRIGLLVASVIAVTRLARV